MKGIGADSAWLAWLALALLVAIFVAAYDIWAMRTNHLTMSAQMAIWLGSSWWGGIALGIWVFLPTMLIYHFFKTKP